MKKLHLSNSLHQSVKMLLEARKLVKVLKVSNSVSSKLSPSAKVPKKLQKYAEVYVKML